MTTGTRTGAVHLRMVEADTGGPTIRRVTGLTNVRGVDVAVW